MSPRAALVAALAFACLAPRTAAAQRLPAGQVLPLSLRWSVPIHQLRRYAPAWKPGDQALAAAFLTALWVDAAQTRSLARTGWRDFRETNPLLGSRPNVGRINTYTAAATVATLGVAALLPQKARRWWLASALVVEVGTVAYTMRIGASPKVR